MNDDQQDHRVSIGEMINVHNVVQPDEPQLSTKGFTVSNIQQPATQQPQPEMPSANNGITADHIQLPVEPPVQESSDE